MAYADGFLIPVPSKNVDAYKRMSELAGEIWMEHGALDYKECVGEDMNIKGMSTSFPQMLGTKKDEIIVFAWIVYRNRAHRDKVMKAVMADPRLKMPASSPFDVKRMLVGGFEVIVDMKPLGRGAPRKTAQRAAKAPAAKKTATKKKATKRAHA